MKLSDVGFHPVDSSLIPSDPKSLPRAPRRLMELMLKGSPSSAETTSKSWSLDFCLTPKEFQPSPTTPEQVGSTVFEQTTLSDPFDPNAYALGTGTLTTLPSSAVFRSIGYKSTALPEFSDLGIPFDERRGVISHDGLGGRVLHEGRGRDASVSLDGTTTFPGLYCAGWVKRGPTGVIASTMEDAFATADAIAEDWNARKRPFLNFGGGGGGKVDGWEGVQRDVGVDTKRVVDWAGWRKIDDAERERGRLSGRERDKFTKTADMLAVLG